MTPAPNGSTPNVSASTTETSLTCTFVSSASRLPSAPARYGQTCDKPHFRKALLPTSLIDCDNLPTAQATRTRLQCCSPFDLLPTYLPTFAFQFFVRVHTSAAAFGVATTVSHPRCSRRIDETLLESNRTESNRTKELGARMYIHPLGRGEIHGGNSIVFS